MSEDKGWRTEDIPAAKRRHIYVDAQGLMNYRFREGVRWLKPVVARQRVMDAYGIDQSAACEVIRTRLVSGHILSSAGSVVGPLKKRERWRINEDREFIGPFIWQCAKMDEPLWSVGDLQMRLIAQDNIRVVTFTDVQFREGGVATLVAAAHAAGEVGPSHSVRSLPPMANVADAPPRAANRAKVGRPSGSGTNARRDAPLLAEMAELINSGQAASPNAAALAVADRAAGGGTLESKAARLRRAFMAMENNGGE